MARRGRRRGRGSSSAWTWVAIVLLGGVIAAALGTFGWMKLQASQTVSLAEDACPVDGATSVTAVLLDTSDAIAPITRLDLQNEFKRVVKDVDKGGLIEVYMLTGNEGELKRTFHACNPGDGSGADPWTSNPKKIQKALGGGVQQAAQGNRGPDGNELRVRTVADYGGYTEDRRRKPRRP